MSPALLLLLSLASCSLLQGMLLRPRDVRLEAQNFHVRVHWKPDPSSPSYATYEVEWRNRTSSWIKAGACPGNSSSWVCELYFDSIYDIYWARVRVVAGGEQSEWAGSSELQLYRDTIVGPPKLSWLLQDQILSVNIITPLTPYQRRTGSYKPVHRVLRKLLYWLHLYEGELLVQQVSCKRSSEGEPCTLGHLKPNTQYCVRTVATGIARERSREAEQCLVTPASPAGFPWVIAMLSAFFLLLLLSVAGLCFMQLQVFPNPPETRLPEALALENSELNMARQVLPLQLEEDPLALLLQTVLPSHRPPTAGQASATVPQLLRGLAQDVSGYCANGFGPDCPEAGAVLQFSGSGPKQGNWDVQVTPGDCRAELVLLHVLVWECPHLGMRGKCLHSEGAVGTLTVTYHLAWSPGPLIPQDNFPCVVLATPHCLPQPVLVLPIL
ncbi:interferon gamma receptor 1-like isoform X3 [Catharus ustulatus]|uniref:interferon gamma receptor 1-like isoform X3 n=1 Tax=Catharus ustulatus TaxID=91951 RepID=UPI0014085CC6|nr:interferon gamma receptor 1-like isoform X3 [Catharus ustulatus]